MAAIFISGRSRPAASPQAPPSVASTCRSDNIPDLLVGSGRTSSLCQVLFRRPLQDQDAPRPISPLPAPCCCLH
uniref:Uncharacterized protein n=1 Tax=Triticum urartu TaxID=4572 RepID=A0A8R7TUK9_TRIUA